MQLAQGDTWFSDRFGAILGFAPWLMKTLSVVGTAAMFLVGGGILTHGLPPVHHAFELAAAAAGPLAPAVACLVADIVPVAVPGDVPG